MGVAACDGKGSSDLVPKISKSATYLIPSDTASCVSKYVGTLDPLAGISRDISSKYFQLKNMTLSYKKINSKFTLVLIQITSNSNYLGGDYKCEIGGDELSVLTFKSGDSSTYRIWDGIIDPAVSTQLVSSGVVTFNCPITCGGIQPEDVDFQSTATIKFIGYETDQNGDETPLSITDSFIIQNLR